MKNVSKWIRFSCMALCLIPTSCNSGIPVDGKLFVRGENVLNFNSIEEDGAVSWISNGYSNGGMFRSRWSRDRVRCEDGIGYLSVYDDGNTNYGAEIRTTQGYLYGYFGGRMKTFKRSGTVQSIFTYNGGHYIWDEIDIEFLGKDTTHVQFNYYSNGQGGHEYWYDLGFDSSEDFHDYGFRWEADCITWYVDFKPVYAVEAKLGQWGRFFVNVWAGQPSVYDWLSKYNPTDVPLEAQYDCLYYAPLEDGTSTLI